MKASGGMARPRTERHEEAGMCRLIRWCAVMGLLMAQLPAMASAAPGDLDASFGTGGIVTTQVGGLGAEHPPAMALQADGKIVVAGTTWESGAGFALARYNPDGSLDPSFAEGQGLSVTNFPTALGSIAHDVAIQSDGKLVVVGSCGCGGFIVARFDAAGDLDTSFGDGDGYITTELGNSEANAVALQPDGKIVVAGRYATEEPTYKNHAIVIRYESDGDVDMGFGEGGEIITEFGADAAIGESLVIQPDERIVLGGYGWKDGNESGLARYNQDGSLDTSFGGGDGYATSAYPAAAALALQPDGKLVFGSGHFSQFSIARVNADGSPDTGFGEGGATDTYIGAPYSWIYGLSLGPSGKIIAAGGVGSVFTGEGADFVIARYTAAGDLDGGFGSNGIVTTPLGGESFASSVAMQPDGKIVAAGENDNGFAIVRYLGGEPVNPPPAGGGGSTSPANPAVPAPLPASTTPSQKPKPLKCQKGFRKQRVKGKLKCIKVKKRRRTVRHEPRLLALSREQQCIRAGLTRPKVEYAEMVHPGTLSQRTDISIVYGAMPEPCHGAYRRIGQFQLRLQDARNHRRWFTLDHWYSGGAFAGDEGGSGFKQSLTTFASEPWSRYRCTPGPGTTKVKLELRNRVKKLSSGKLAGEKIMEAPVRVRGAC